MATTTTIKAAARVLGEGKLIADGARFVVVASNTCPGAHYLVTWDAVAARWTCSCTAAKYGRTCSHVKAASEHAGHEAHRTSVAPVAVAVPTPAAAARPATRHDPLPLGPSAAFSMWK